MLVKSHPFSEGESEWSLDSHRLVVAGPIATEELINKSYKINKIRYYDDKELKEDEEILCLCNLIRIPDRKTYITICLNNSGWWLCTDDVENQLVYHRATSNSTKPYWVYSDDDGSMIYEANSVAEEIYLRLHSIGGLTISKSIADQMFSLFGI